MRKHEQKIVKVLSASSAIPSDSFRTSLKNKIISISLGKSINQRGFEVFRTKLIYVMGVLFLAAVAFGVFLNINKDDGVVLNEDNGSGSITMSLPTTTLASIAEAKSAVDFELRLPSDKLSDEEISLIEKYENPTGDNQFTVAIKYADGQGTLYRISQSRFIGAVDETAETVKITFLGKTIDAKLTVLSDGSEDPNSGITLGGDSVPSSFLAWETDGVAYEVSEFGRVSKAQLVDIAESLK